MKVTLTRLTSREREVLTLAARGYTCRKMASTLSVSTHTIWSTLENARTKLGVLNTTAAVALALSRGEISLEETNGR